MFLYIGQLEERIARDCQYLSQNEIGSFLEDPFKQNLILCCPVVSEEIRKIFIVNGRRRTQSDGNSSYDPSCE
jgi:hypothetical protein